MRRPVLLASLAVLLVALLSAGPTAGDAAGGRGPVAPGGRAESHAPERILVAFKPGVSEREQERVHRRHGGAVVEAIPGIDVQVVRVPRGRDQRDEEHERRKARDYSRESAVEFAEPDGVVEPAFAPDDPLFGQQWALVKIQAPQAWDIATGVLVKVAVLDTGIDRNHEDVSAKTVANVNYSSSPTVDDLYGHGTHVAGIIAASTRNAKGVAGGAPDAVLMNVKVLRDSDGGGYWSWVAKGIRWSADSGADVINMSLGASVGSATLRRAVDYAWSKGVVLVAAAGNQSSQIVLYPAYYINVVAVAATDRDDRKSDFSNYGVGIDIAAPGGRWGTSYEWLDPGIGVLATMPNHANQLSSWYGVPLTYGPLAGTSMATPHVAAVAALLISKCPAWTNLQVRQRLETSTDPLATGYTALDRVGRLNAYKAVAGGC